MILRGEQPSEIHFKIRDKAYDMANFQMSESLGDEIIGQFTAAIPFIREMAQHSNISMSAKRKVITGLDLLENNIDEIGFEVIICQ
jgi:hypothetical protein